MGEARNEYTYSAGGAKLRVVHKWNPNYSTAPIIGSGINESSLTMTQKTDYVGNIIYENDNLKRILVAGGYWEGGQYYFYLTDHLGNNRAVVKADGTTVVQKNQYYPFGMSFADRPVAEKGLQPYKYNGKELDQMHGLNTYDYHARQQDFQTGRFTSVDPLAEKYYSWSPYAYCANNPIKYIDPTGMDWYQSKDGSATIWKEGNAATYTHTIGEGEDAINIEMDNIGSSYIQYIDNMIFIWKQNVMMEVSPLVEYDYRYKAPSVGEIKQTPRIGAHATGWSVNVEITAGRSIETAVISAITFHVGNDVGETFYYQTTSDGGGILDGGISYNLISYYYRGYEGNFDHTTLLGGGFEIVGSLGPFSGGWNVSYPDRYNARTYSQTYGLGLGVSPINLGVRKTKTEAFNLKK